MPKLAETFDLQLSWNYFATSHGKGPNDALGGNVKRMVQTRVLTRKAVVCNAEDFKDIIKDTESKIRITVMCTDRIEQTNNELLMLLTARIWKDIPQLTGINNTHFLHVLEKDTIVCKFYTSAEHFRQLKVKEISEGEIPVTDENVIPARKSSERAKDNTKVSSMSRKKDTNKDNSQSPCGKCGFIYGQADDPKGREDWVQCNTCVKWFHETCREEFGIFDDIHFTCLKCC